MIPPKQNPDFVCAMEQVLEVYKRPYNPLYPVVCLDETTKQLVKQIRTPIRKANAEQLYDYEYERNGVAHLYMLYEPLAGQRSVLIKHRHTRIQWAEAIVYLVREMYHTANKITVVQDNLAAHKPSAIYEILPPKQAAQVLSKVEFVHTPKHGSWLNMAEIEFSAIARQCLNQRIPNTEALAKQIAQWQRNRNQKRAKTNWQFTAQDARIKLRRLYPTLIY